MMNAFFYYDLLDIYTKYKVPIVFDNLHYECYGDTSMSIPELLPLIQRTWKKDDGDMKIHYSQQNPLRKKNPWRYYHT